MGFFFYNKIDSIIPMVALPTTEIIEPKLLFSGHLSTQIEDKVLRRHFSKGFSFCKVVS